MKDYFGYQEKVVIVTGASSGMGKATAEILVDLGAKVYALDWNACDVKGIEKFVQVDLSKKDSINQAMKELPKHVDSFFGIAGVSGMKNDFMTTVSIDFIANKYICEEYLIHSTWHFLCHEHLQYISSIPKSQTRDFNRFGRLGSLQPSQSRYAKRKETDGGRSLHTEKAFCPPLFQRHQLGIHVYGSRTGTSRIHRMGI